VRARAEAEEHALRIKDAEARLAEARAEERAALDLVANRKADVDVLVKDRERFLMEARKRAEAREEEAAAEAHRPVKV
jgi:hypothetical protein